MEKTPLFKSTSVQAASSGQARNAHVEQEVSVDDSKHLTGQEEAAEPSGFAHVVSRVLGSVSTWGFVDQGIVSVASFAAAAIVGRVCGSDQLGVYSLAVSLFWLVAGIPNALVWTPYTSRAPKLSGDTRRQYAGSALIHVLVVALTIAACFVLIGLIPWPSLSTSAWFWPMCLAMAPFTLLMMLREHLRRILFAHMNTRGLLFLDLPIALMQIGVILWLANAERLTFLSALIAMALPCLWCCVWLVRHRKQFSLSRTRARNDWQDNFQFGRWLLFVSIAWLLGDASFRWLVGSLHGLNELGQFSAAFTTVMFVNPIMLTVQNLARSIFSNRLAERGQHDLRKLAFQGTWHMAWIFGLLFSGLALGGGLMVQLLFGNEFEGLGWVVASLCLGLYVQVLNFPVDAALSALRGGRAMLAASLVRLVLILGSGVPLIAWYGSIGVGAALAIGSLGAGVLQWNLFLRRFHDAK